MVGLVIDVFISSYTNRVKTASLATPVYRVKSGKFKHHGKFEHIFANSGDPNETAPYESSHQDIHFLLR